MEPSLLQTSEPRAVVVTGATSGIGLAAAELLAGRQVFVIGVGRSDQRCRAAEKHLRLLSPDQKAICLTADLSLQSEVRRVAEEIHQVLTDNGFASLYGLLNNAGLFRYFRETTAEGIETQWATNHLAAFLLTNLLLPLLQAGPAARVATVSSQSHYGGHMHWKDVQLTRKYWGFSAYGQSKLANVLFTFELNRRLGDTSSVRAYACDPGLVRTKIGAKDLPAIIRLGWNVHSSRGITAEQSASGIVRVLLEPAIQGRKEIYWKHGKPKQPSQRALNEADAARLWDLSEKMTGISALKQQ